MASHDAVVVGVVAGLSEYVRHMLPNARRLVCRINCGPRGRTFLAIDNPNMLGTAREHGVSVFFDKVRLYLDGQSGRVVEAKFFTQASGFGTEHERFIKQIEAAGYATVNALPGRPKNGKQHPDIDCLLLTDILAHPERFDTCVVLSGDLDYLPAFKHLRSIGKRVEVWAFPDSTSQDIKDEVDAFVDLRTLPGVCKPRH